jgi:hypothetical protein
MGLVGVPETGASGGEEMGLFEVEGIEAVVVESGLVEAWGCEETSSRYVLLG